MAQVSSARSSDVLPKSVASIDELSGRENDSNPNQDHCEACGEGGELLCCDNCPRSFHFACVNPPMSTYDVQTMQGNWYCNVCRSKLNPPKLPPQVTHLNQLFTQLQATNPEAFKLPAEVWELVKEASSKRGDSSTAKEESKTSSGSASSSRAATNKKDLYGKSKAKEDFCKVCTLGGDLISCFLCGKSYHLYCLDPPLLYRPMEPWQCPNHQDATKVAHLVPDQTFKISFLPNNNNSKTENTNGIEAHTAKKNLPEMNITELEETSWLLGLSQARDHRAQPVAQQLAQLQQEQAKFLQSALPTSFDIGQINSVDATTSSTAVILSQLTPLFTQFLAWQRLMQINRQIQYLQQVHKPELQRQREQQQIQARNEAIRRQITERNEQEQREKEKQELVIKQIQEEQQKQPEEPQPQKTQQPQTPQRASSPARAFTRGRLSGPVEPTPTPTPIAKSTTPTTPLSPNVTIIASPQQVVTPPAQQTQPQTATPTAAQKKRPAPTVQGRPISKKSRPWDPQPRGDSESSSSSSSDEENDFYDSDGSRGSVSSDSDSIPSPDERVTKPKKKKAPATEALAYLEDENGKKLLVIRKDEILLGRRKRLLGVDDDEGLPPVDFNLCNCATPKTVSRSHAKITRDPVTRMFWFHNLGRNGSLVNDTFVGENGKALLSSPVSVFEIGKTKYKFRYGAKG